MPIKKKLHCIIENSHAQQATNACNKKLGNYLYVNVIVCLICTLPNCGALIMFLVALESLP